jgi:iron complex transport system ATP-binding protein
MEILLENLSAGYSAHSVLQGVSLTLRSGTFTALMGANGAGKSTLLRTITGYLPPLQGRVLIDQADAAAIPPQQRARCIAVVPQDEPSVFDFSVRDVVLMGRYPHSRKSLQPPDHEAASRALAQMDILPLAERMVSQLSGGERRRVLIARALAQETPALLLDEPTAHLDPGHQTELLSLLRSLADSGRTVVAALHDLASAANYAHRVVLLRAGNITAEGTPSEVFTPGNLSEAFEAQFHVASNPITGAPMPVTAASAAMLRRQEKIHVICGGGTGIRVLSTLRHAGYPLTAGVLNVGDADHAAAKAFGIRMIEIPGFTAIDAEAETQHRALAAAADIVVISDVPWGHGNLANLRVAHDALASGGVVWHLFSGDMRLLDFTGGEASHILREMLRNGLQQTEDIDSLLLRLRTTAA